MSYPEAILSSVFSRAVAKGSFLAKREVCCSQNLRKNHEPVSTSFHFAKGQLLLLSLRTECFQAPLALRFFMAQHVPVPVSRHHSKVRRSRRIPAILYLRHFILLPAQDKPHRTLVRPVSRIALHFDFHVFRITQSKPTRRTRSWKRGSLRSGSNEGSTLSVATMLKCCE